MSGWLKSGFSTARKRLGQFVLLLSLTQPSPQGEGFVWTRFLNIHPPFRPIQRLDSRKTWQPFVTLIGEEAHFRRCSLQVFKNGSSTFKSQFHAIYHTIEFYEENLVFCIPQACIYDGKIKALALQVSMNMAQISI